jgi:hypothetical protein
MAIIYKIAILMAALAWGAAAHAERTCRPLTPAMVHERVEGILAASSGVEAEYRLDQLYRAWSNRCEPRASIFRRSVALDLARLLPRLYLVDMTAAMLDEMDNAARPAQRRVHRAYLRHHRAMEARSRRFGFLTGAEPGLVQMLGCLDLELQTGRETEYDCREFELWN